MLGWAPPSEDGMATELIPMDKWVHRYARLLNVIIGQYFGFFVHKLENTMKTWWKQGEIYKIALWTIIGWFLVFLSTNYKTQWKYDENKGKTGISETKWKTHGNLIHVRKVQVSLWFQKKRGNQSNHTIPSSLACGLPSPTFNSYNQSQSCQWAQAWQIRQNPKIVFGVQLLEELHWSINVKPQLLVGITMDDLMVIEELWGGLLLGYEEFIKFLTNVKYIATLRPLAEHDNALVIGGKLIRAFNAVWCIVLTDFLVEREFLVGYGFLWGIAGENIYIAHNSLNQ